MIELAGVAKSYGDTEALAPTDLSMASGSTTLVIGPSGCGKSTLLRLLVGLVEADGGRILIEGVELRPDTLRAVRHRTGYVIQEGGLFPHLTAKDNVAILPRHLGRNADWIEGRIAELAELVQLDRDVIARFPLELSGGQRQRVSLMRALVLDPDLLLLDEPLGALDPMIRADLQEDLRRIFRELEKTVVMVTHDLHEAAFFADTIVLMQQGRVIQTGSIEELRGRPATGFVRRFIEAQNR